MSIESPACSISAKPPRSAAATVSARWPERNRDARAGAGMEKVRCDFSKGSPWATSATRVPPSKLFNASGSRLEDDAHCAGISRTATSASSKRVPAARS
ncbi:hypothetical protein D3C72_2108700 [compost metagenome]